jgi:hypothetical protein
LIFGGAWAYDVVYLVAERQTPMLESLAQALFWSPLSAALTAIAGVLVMQLFRVSLDPRAR